MTHKTRCLVTGWVIFGAVLLSLGKPTTWGLGLFVVLQTGLICVDLIIRAINGQKS